jgi:hypothetical protein
MAKSSIRTYSTTAASNTDVGGVDIQGTAPASNMNDAVQEVMSHLAETNAGTSPVDDTWSFCDPADATKKVRLDAGGVTAGQTRVLAAPNYDGTLATLAGAETFTNKTLASPAFTGTPTGLDASTTAKGIVELATDAEAQTGTDTAMAITPANLQAVTATETRKGVVELATTAEVTTGTDTARAVTPAGVKAATDALLYTGSTVGNTTFPVGSYVTALTTGTEPDRNASATVRLRDSNSGDFTLDGSGSALTGTWRARGRSGFSSGTTWVLMQRTA